VGALIEVIDGLKNVRLLILDVDGVLTDGSLYYDKRGEALKRFHVLDGLGIRRIMEAGLTVAVISGRRSRIARKRLKELGIDLIREAAYDKVAAFQDIRACCPDIRDEEIAYIGDDVNDVAIMKEVAVPIAVANALDEVKGVARYITRLRGGEGAVREVCDLILRSRSK
jgi:3-deoxy-D-manno-octulosonate 8-phosphate phosphatase (KDO 8-P phosphatase)